MSKSNVCKCWKKLINKGILIQDGKHTLINANLFLKGQYRTLNPIRKEYVQQSLRTTSEGIEDVFVIPWNGFPKPHPLCEPSDRPTAGWVGEGKPIQWVGFP